MTLDGEPTRDHVHPSLIAVTNGRAYGNKLFIVPSPDTSEAGLGLRFRAVAGGVIDSGTGTNPVGAKAVVETVLWPALAHQPLSLGKVAWPESTGRTRRGRLRDGGTAESSKGFRWAFSEAPARRAPRGPTARSAGGRRCVA